MSEKAAEPFRAPAAPIDLFNWEKDGYSHPESYARLYGVENVGLFARLWSFEDSVRCECTKRDDPIYTDSCLEIFLKPVTGDERYVNFEVNRNGVYLSQIGEKREGRRFIREVTSLEPTITPFTLPGSGKSAWGYDIFLPDGFISEVYGAPYRTAENIIKGNFYKCADLAEAPHYAACFPVDSAELGFHNPARFGNIILRKA